jgi:hypothetical protein
VCSNCKKTRMSIDLNPIVFLDLDLLENLGLKRVKYICKDCKVRK